MGYWDAVLSFVVAAVIAAALTPLAARLARRIGAIDMPRDRGLAERATPLLGGWRSSPRCWWPRLIWMPAEFRLPAHLPRRARIGRHGPYLGR